MELFDEKIVVDASNPSNYWYAVLNPDGSRIAWGWGTPYSMKAYYNSDATYEYEYYCEADAGSVITNPVWRIFRVRNSVATGKFFDKTWAWTSFNHTCPDLATVEWYTYA